jgi:hypothetical protein
MLVVTLICFSCNKNDVDTPPGIATHPESNEQKRNEATWIKDESKATWLMRLLFFTGHSIEVCGGQCVKILGEFGHIDCRGFGDACSNVTRAHLSMDESGNYTLILEDPDIFGEYLEFDFPSRSLFITNPQNATELWLNIQEQLLVRENFELSFKIQDVWFSEDPELDNP